MKKIILLVLFVSNLGFGQSQNLTGTANYILKSYALLGNARYDNCGYGGLWWLHVNRNSGPIFLKNNDNTSWHNDNFYFPDIEFNESNLITSFSIFSNTRGKNFVGTCNEQTKTEIQGKPIQRYQTINYINDIPNGGVLAQNFGGTIGIITYPVIKLTLPNAYNDIVGSDDYINMLPIDGILNQYYAWQYSSNTIPWTNFQSQHQNKNYFNVIGNELLPPTDHNSDLKIRVKIGTNGLTSNEITLKYRISEPHIIKTGTNKPIYTQTSCYSDTNDGSVKVTFDRALLPNETISLDLQGRNGSDDPDDIYNLTTFQTGNTYLITGLGNGDFTLMLSGSYNGSSPFNLGPNHKLDFTIEKPSPVAFTATKTDVLCYNGNDGKITITASGGTTQGANTYQYSLDLGTTWIPFTSGNTHAITGLEPANYIIKVRDSKSCVARYQTPTGNGIELGLEIPLPLTIQSIATPVVVTYTEVKQPTFYGGTNGKMVVAVTGGTPFANNSYDFEWINGVGVVQTNTTTTFSGGIFYITLNDIGAGNYILNVKDKNYATATQQGGCSFLDSLQILPQPEPILVTFNALPPKCNVNNLFGNETDLNPADGKRDESQNGQLVATVTGGVPYTGFQNYSKPYKYFWKKQLPDGTWQSIDNQSTTLPYVSDGNYALNVEDSNLIKLGIYTNNVLTQEVDKTVFVQQPAQLELALTKQDVTCGNANTGSATANVSGGVSGYTYQWNDANSSTTQTITGLGAGNYFVRVTDANGCVVQGSVNLPQPSNIVISDNAQNPSCFQGTDGAIDLIIRGGNAPFTYLWNTRDRTEDLTNIPAGNYTVTITDRLGCTFQHDVILINPNPIIVNLGADRTLCNNQSNPLDISINDPNAQYLWTSTNGFTSRASSVSLTQAGTYHAKVISSLGCIGEDDIVIQTNQVNIESEFFVTSQAYLDEEVMLVNTSNPFGENTQWIIPNGVNIIDQQQKFVVLKFNTIGTHTISLKQTQGNCYALYSKNINVEDRSNIPNANNNNIPFIKDFIVTPNPNNGQFTTVVNLQEISPVKLRLFSYSGQTAIIQKSEAGKKNYVVDFNAALPSGTYVLVLETAQQTLIRKIIIL